MTTLVQGDVRSDYPAGVGNTQPVLVSVTTGNVVIAGCQEVIFGAPVTTAELGGEAMTELAFDEIGGWVFFYRVVTGAETNSTVVFDQSGPLTDSVTFAAEFDASTASSATYTGLDISGLDGEIPEDFIIPLEAASGDALYVFATATGQGGGTISFSTPTGHTLVDTGSQSSGTERATAILTHEVEAAQFDAATSAVTTSGTENTLEQFIGFRLVLALTEAAVGDATFPNRRVRIDIADLPYLVSTAMVGGIRALERAIRERYT